MTEFTHQSARKSSNLKKWLLPVVSVVVVAALSFVAVSVVSNMNKPSTLQSTSNERTSNVNGYAIKYPKSWYPINIGSQDSNDGVVLKLARKSPQASFVWRMLGGEVGKDVKVSELPDQVATSLAKELPGFKLVSKGTTKLGEFDAAEVRYKQNGTGEKAKDVFENKMYIVPRTENTYYLTIGAKDGEFAKVEASANKILDSAKGYVASHP
jgi:hypothetical protein